MPTIEDEIESQRQKKVEELKRLGKSMTPITEETFNAWWEKKRKKREEENRKLVQAELKKKKGGKGLSVLTGRDLYNFKKDLFDKVDDDEDGEDGESVDGNDNNGNDDDSNTNSSRKENGAENGHDAAVIDQVAAKVQSDLFLQGDDEDLDDLLDDD